MMNQILRKWEQKELSHQALLLYICLYRKAVAKRSYTVQCNLRQLCAFLHISYQALQQAISTLVTGQFVKYTPGNNRTPGTFTLYPSTETRCSSAKLQCSPTKPQRSPSEPQRSSSEPHSTRNINIQQYSRRKSSVPVQDKDKFEKEDLWNM